MPARSTLQMQALSRPFRSQIPRMKPLQIRKCAFVVLLLAVLFAAVTRAQKSKDSSQSNAATLSRPRLVVLIVVDQFRYDYLTRFGDLFAARGLRRLLREGAVWSNANFDHVPTFTAPGHAVFLTGAGPSRTGIIAN